MASIFQSPEAQNDLIEIWLYIRQDNEIAADRIIDAINEKLILLSESPQMGKLCEELAPSLRSFSVGKYLLFYRSVVDGIELVRVIHGARDIQNLFE
ncbi:type II toxin-antitoxin system RelE/ParE family toxin [Sphaerospermopsis sp. LEGE 08334]|jgi:toxin ParE1/3/4|uniref:type II toxin-antitoxin system RelE/ParE family toxin n=1 Tax=Sphaerospermopsis sp. LEGE 08334 TaxID=1828651 RepID=UPI0018822528|nr:type II toxin-antitoxin system RelE/ParE family toxin [Sphaerospermopsis sp. LEGE 08334]MBE9057521.1 type II toxin-antitoxin system RelE/ParE family toxin [Sphaerospermopsis sp. LEGE 08334]